MTNTVDGNRQLEGSLHYDPAAYWCGHCWQFMKDCKHLVPPLKTRLVSVEDWLIRAVRYDRVLVNPSLRNRLAKTNSSFEWPQHASLGKFSHSHHKQCKKEDHENLA